MTWNTSDHGSARPPRSAPSAQSRRSPHSSQPIGARTPPHLRPRPGPRDPLLSLPSSSTTLCRFFAVDAGKVEQLGHHGTKIRLVVEHTGHTLNSEQMTPHFGKIHVGSQYFALLRTDGNALRQGDLVTIVVGKLALQHMKVL